MLNRFKLIPVGLLLAVIISCNLKPKAKETKEPEKVVATQDTVVAPPAHNATDDLVAFIAGVPGAENPAYVKIDSATNWKAYSKELDDLFTLGDTLRIKKMENWADSELIRDPAIKNLFYPFSGPDFLNANIFYKDIDQIIMIGLEPVGSLPDVLTMKTDAVKKYMYGVTSTMVDLMKRSYFITAHMDSDLSRAKINGTLPMISIFMKRRGYFINEVNKIGVDSVGNLLVLDSLKSTKKHFVRGIKISYSVPGSTKVQSVLYFRSDISDKGLLNTPGFKSYLAHQPKSYTYLKAASFLMHFDEFSVIRNTIFDISNTILQDDSGIAYKYFDKTKWDIRLYGKYSKPRKEFDYILETDLENAFKTSKVKPLTYTLGYNWRNDHTSLLYAIKK